MPSGGAERGSCHGQGIATAQRATATASEGKQEWVWKDYVNFTFEKVGFCKDTE